MKKAICALLLLLSWSYTYSQEMTDTLRHSSVVAFAVKSVTPVHTLSGESLQRLSSQSIADALRYFSGIQIKDYGGIGGLKTVNVRSLGAQHVGIFYDGIQITNAQNGQVDLGRYSLDNLEEVSLYNAQKSETLQSATEYASGSTVYLRTMVPKFEGAKNYNLTARLKAGSFKSLNPSIRYEQKIGKVTLSADGMYLYSKGDYRFRIRNSLEDTTGRRSNGDIQAARAELGVWAKPWNGNLQVHLYHYDSERGLPGPVIRRLSEQYSFKDRQWDRNSFIQSSYSKTFEKFAFLLNAKASGDYLEYLSDPADNAAAPYIHNKYKQSDVYASASLAWYPTDWITFNTAVDERWSDLNTDAAYMDYVQRWDTRAVLASSFVMDGFTLQASALYTNVSDNGTSTFERLSPSLILGWNNPGETLSARAFYKSSFRVPTFNDLYYTLVGNSNLKPEYTRQLDLGLTLNSPKDRELPISLWVDFYYSAVKDKIVAMPAKSMFRWSMVNFGKVRIMGADTRARISYRSLSALFTYSFERAIDLSDPTSISYRGQIPYTPMNSGSMILSYVHGAWDGSLSFLLTGRRFSSVDNIKANELSPWTTTDIHVSRAFGKTIRFGLDLNNIFNQRYEVVIRYPMPGINFMLNLTIKI